MTEGVDTTTATRDSAQAQTWTLSETRMFVYDATSSPEGFAAAGWNCIFERRVDAAQTVTDTAYVWGLDLSGSMQGAGGIGGLLQASRNVGGGVPTATLFAYDGNGNVTAMVDAADGSVVARYDYSPFGMTVLADGPAAAANPWRFSSKYHDSETALVYYGYRYYSSELGRWISKDPHFSSLVETTARSSSELAALSRFVANRPVGRIDFLGRWPLCACLTPVPAPPTPLTKPGMFRLTTAAGTCVGAVLPGRCCTGACRRVFLWESVTAPGGLRWQLVIKAAFGCI
jgi:RHS repeat-associated protein